MINKETGIKNKTSKIMRVTIVIMVLTLITNTVYAVKPEAIDDITVVDETEEIHAGTQERIEYHIKKYEEHWDSIIDGEEEYDKNTVAMRENEVINSILLIDNKEMIDKFMGRYNKLKETKSSEYVKRVKEVVVKTESLQWRCLIKLGVEQ